LIGLNIFDYVFVFSATAFNLLIAGIFIAQKKGLRKLVKIFGIIWLSLGVPLTVVFIRYLIEGKTSWILIYFGFVLFYMVVELLLDYILKFDFRSRKITHIPYIILEYIALFGLIGISFDIHPTWGTIVSISFWVLLGCLVYLYRGGKDKVEGKAE